MATWTGITSTSTLTKRQIEREKFHERRRLSFTKKYDLSQTTDLVKAFKKKASRRMKTFYEESTRMDKKFPEMLAKAKELGLEITNITLNSVVDEDIRNPRKRSKGGLSFDVSATKEHYKLKGVMKVSPASMRIELNCPELKGVCTKSGYQLPTYKITYYRSLVVTDNWLPSLVGGRNPYYTKVSNAAMVEF